MFFLIPFMRTRIFYIIHSRFSQIPDIPPCVVMTPRLRRCSKTKTVSCNFYVWETTQVFAIVCLNEPIKTYLSPRISWPHDVTWHVRAQQTERVGPSAKQEMFLKLKSLLEEWFSQCPTSYRDGRPTVLGKSAQEKCLPQFHLAAHINTRKIYIIIVLQK